MTPNAPDLRLYGHRGASALLPENTLPAFERALADGANALELDVHPTADGHFVVAHDPDAGHSVSHGKPARCIYPHIISREYTTRTIRDTYTIYWKSPHNKPTNFALISGYLQSITGIQIYPVENDLNNRLLGFRGRK